MTQNPPFFIHPLFDTAGNLLQFGLDLKRYPSLAEFIDSCPGGAFDDWTQASKFLSEYTASHGTFSRFRCEIQRFLLFLWREQQITLTACNEDDVNAYMRFLKSPPEHWVARAPANAFKTVSGVRTLRALWRPFVGKGEYEARQATIDAAVRALSVFFRVLIARGYLKFSPLSSARRGEQKIDAEDSDEDDDTLAPRLTASQWNDLKEALLAAAEEDDKYERHLFIVMTMKTLYLRVSELAPQENLFSGKTYIPTMGAFRQKVIDGFSYWHLRVVGKGRKVRYVPLPSGYIYYLKRFRRWRALPPLPERGEKTAMIPRKNGGGQIQKRAVENLVNESFLLTAGRLEQAGRLDEASDMRQLAGRTHYLRHTGASMDIEAGRPIRHVSEDLGHASVAFTEMIYISSSSSERYKTGLGRTI